VIQSQELELVARLSDKWDQDLLRERSFLARVVNLLWNNFNLDSVMPDTFLPLWAEMGQILRCYNKEIERRGLK